MTAPGTRVVTVLHHRLRVDIRPGDTNRTPLLMCCGIGASFEVLEPLLDAIDPHIEVIRFDAPGVGGSPATALPVGFPQLALLVARMLDQLGYRRVDVLGFSWGGALAQQLAVQHGCRVRHLVLVSTGTGMLMVPGRPGVLRRMLSPRRFRDPEYAASIAATLYGASTRAHSDEVLHLFRDKQTGGSRRGYLYQLLAGAGWTSLPFLTLIRQPTLIITGDDDPIVPPLNGWILARMIPNSTLHVFRGGHIAPVIEPGSIGPVISQFLQQEPS